MHYYSIFFLLLISTLISLSKGTQCPPFPTTETGPTYKFRAPEKERYVCDPRKEAPKDLSRIDPNSCSNKICYLRSITHHNEGLSLIVSGVIREAGTCKPIPNAILDIWQPDHYGFYGSFQAGEEDGYCRAIIKANEKGEYEFETERPGSYGALSGLNGGFMGYDVPPFGTMHIHIILWKPGYKLLTTQLYFSDDVAVHHDFRAVFMNHSLGADNPVQRLNLTKGTKSAFAAEMNFNLKKDSDSEYAGLTKEDAIRRDHCKSASIDFAEPFPVCWPRITSWMRWRRIFYSWIAVVLGLIVWVLWTRTNTNKKLNVPPQKKNTK